MSIKLFKTICFCSHICVNSHICLFNFEFFNFYAFFKILFKVIVSERKLLNIDFFQINKGLVYVTPFELRAPQYTLVLINVNIAALEMPLTLAVLEAFTSMHHSSIIKAQDFARL